MKVEIIDSLRARLIGQKYLDDVTRLFEFESEYWKQGVYRREKIAYTKSMIDRRSGRFYRGLLYRLDKYCKANNIELQVIDNSPIDAIKPMYDPYIGKDIKLRDYQLDMIDTITKYGRGVVNAATGTGKSYIILGFLSQFDLSAKILHFVHTKDLLYQTHELYKKHDIGDIGLIGDGLYIGEREMQEKDIIIAMIQSFSNLDVKKFNMFDIIIIDEAHRVSEFNSQYGKVLMKLDAPIRVGLTATLHEDTRKRLVMESLIGGVISKMTISEATNIDAIADARVKLIPVPFSLKLADYSRYADIYKHAVVRNRSRNRLIVREIKDNESKGLSTLVMTDKIEHGELIKGLCDDREIEIRYINGQTNSLDRLKAKRDLQDKKVLSVMTTFIWKEGIDIPAIDCFIFSLSARSTITILQTIGRSLRKSGDRKVEIVDFIDEYKYLSSHFAKRLKLYIENGWEIYA